MVYCTSLYLGESLGCDVGFVPKRGGWTVHAIVTADHEIFIKCVCVSVKSHLTYGVFVHPEISVTYSVSNNGKNIAAISLKLLHCKGPTLPLLYSYAYRGHLSAESMHAHNLPRGGPKAASHFYLW